ncbi:serine/threonine-protein phosphatase Pgam5, partial [Striga asiatica]
KEDEREPQQVPIDGCILGKIKGATWKRKPSTSGRNQRKCVDDRAKAGDQSNKRDREDYQNQTSPEGKMDGVFVVGGFWRSQWVLEVAYYCSGLGDYHWVPGLNGGKPEIKVQIDANMFRVKDLLCNGGVSWDSTLIKALFKDGDASEILKIKGLNPNSEDVLKCSFATKGKFSVKTAY